MVKKEDWKTVEMPAQTEAFVLEKALTQEDIKRIEEGHKPEEMEDKWFMYVENGKLFIHRSWTGYCIYIVALSENGALHTVVNRDPAQYKEKNVEQDKIQLTILINRLIQQTEENTRLIRLYLERAISTKEM